MGVRDLPSLVLGGWPADRSSFWDTLQAPQTKAIHLLGEDCHQLWVAPRRGLTMPQEAKHSGRSGTSDPVAAQLLEDSSAPAAVFALVGATVTAVTWAEPRPAAGPGMENNKVRLGDAMFALFAGSNMAFDRAVMPPTTPLTPLTVGSCC